MKMTHYVTDIFNALLIAPISKALSIPSCKECPIQGK